MATIVAPLGITDTLLSGTIDDDQIYGAQGDDTLIGLDGNDYLDGGAGYDSLIGGLGNDTYIVDNIGDVVVENANEGTDTIETYFNVDLTSLTQFGGYLANVENFILLGGSATLGTGNVHDNSILGNGNANILDGGGGNDSIDGGGGNDSVLAGLGNDSLAGSYGNDTLDGDVGNDTLDGGSGNDCLYGGGGADSMTGGTGNDSFFVDDTGDVVSEAANQGSDYIFSSVDYTIPANIDGLVLTGNLITTPVGGWDNLNATGGNFTNDSLVGNAGKNTLTGLGGSDSLLGMSGNDTLFGGDGNDSLIGGSGVDSLLGGVGDDTYEMGFDYRVAVTDSPWLSSLTTSQVVNGDYVYEYNPANPALSTLWQVTDQTNLGNVAGYTDTNRPGSTPRVQVTSTADLYALTTTQVKNGDYVYQYDQTTPASSILWQVTDITKLNNAGGYTATGRTGPTALFSTDIITEGSLVTDGIDLVRSSATFDLSSNGANVENLTLIGSDNISGTGNGGNNVLTGNIGNNSLYGGIGNDTLDGAAGTDTLIGGAADDYYILNSQTDDTTIELAGGGTDTIQTSVNFSLLSGPTFKYIDNLVLTGSAIMGKGNNPIQIFPGVYVDGNNAITGNAQDNQLSGLDGKDTLYGGLGSDILDGGIGNDTLIGGNNTLFGGTDTDTGNDQLLGGDGDDCLDGGNGNDVLSGGKGATAVGDFLLGGAGNDLLLGGTNGLPGQTDRDTAFPSDTLVGGSGNDTLDGGNGTNSLLGGLGDDLVYVRAKGLIPPIPPPDIAIELPGEGWDTLIGNYSLDLSTSGQFANFEVASLFGQGSINLTGNDEGNFLVGNDGVSVAGHPGYGATLINNIIEGKQGSDTILGGAGLDYIWGDNSDGSGNGNDSLDGGTSASPNSGDTMDGGMGNDTYTVDDKNDRIRESQLVDDQSVDTVLTYVNFDPLPAWDANNVTRAPSFANLDITSFELLENFIFMDDALRGVGVPIRGVGNVLGNEFTGNLENNVILGLGGDDTIVGGAGDDSLFGDADYGDPLAQYDRYATPALPIYDPKTGAYPSNPGAYANAVSGLQDADPFGHPSVPLTTAQVNLLIDPTFTGLPGAVAVEGYFDSLVGGAGDDVLSGGGGADTLLGGDGDDCLVGGTGDDSMLGSVGDDTFFIDNYEDVVVELPGQGTDLIRSTVDIYRLQDNVENLTIYGRSPFPAPEISPTVADNPSATLGVGNDLDNVIDVAQFPESLPNYPGEVIPGVPPAPDTTDPVGDVTGVTLSGGMGNDTLIGFSKWHDTGKEPGGTGYFDRVANDYLDGGSGNDFINGGLNKLLDGDTLAGGLGNDTLVVDSFLDHIVEYNYEGNQDVGNVDLVISGVDRLDFSDTVVKDGMFVENMTLLGEDTGVDGVITGTGSGNRLNNVMTGNEINNNLTGEWGNDTVIGGKLNDTLFGDFDAANPTLTVYGSDMLIGGSTTGFGSIEIDYMTGDVEGDLPLGNTAGLDTFYLADLTGEGFYRNQTNNGVGLPGNAYGTKAYAVIQDFANGKVLDKTPQVEFWYTDANGKPALETKAGFYVAKDVTNLPTLDTSFTMPTNLTGGNYYGVFVSLDTSSPGRGTDPERMDDLVALAWGANLALAEENALQIVKDSDALVG